MGSVSVPAVHRNDLSVFGGFDPSLTGPSTETSFPFCGLNHLPPVLLYTPSVWLPMQCQAEPKEPVSVVVRRAQRQAPVSTKDGPFGSSPGKYGSWGSMPAVSVSWRLMVVRLFAWTIAQLSIGMLSVIFRPGALAQVAGGENLNNHGSWAPTCNNNSISLEHPRHGPTSLVGEQKKQLAAE